MSQSYCNYLHHARQRVIRQKDQSQRHSDKQFPSPPLTNKSPFQSCLRGSRFHCIYASRRPSAAAAASIRQPSSYNSDIKGIPVKRYRIYRMLWWDHRLSSATIYCITITHWLTHILTICMLFPMCVLYMAKQLRRGRQNKSLTDWLNEAKAYSIQQMVIGIPLSLSGLFLSNEIVNTHFS